MFIQMTNLITVKNVVKLLRQKVILTYTKQSVHLKRLLFAAYAENVLSEILY